MVMIESGIPVPTKNSYGKQNLAKTVISALKNAQIGDSVFIPHHEIDGSLAQIGSYSVSANIRISRKKSNEGYRFWRVS